MARGIPLLAVVWMGCGSNLSIVHERAFIGEYRDVFLADDAADLHARLTNPSLALNGDVVRQDISSREIIDQLAFPASSQLRDVVENNTIRVLFVEHPTDASRPSTVVIATTSSAEEVRRVEDGVLYDAVLMPDGFATAESAPDTGCVVTYWFNDGTIHFQADIGLQACTNDLRLVSGRPSSAVGYSNGASSGVVSPEGHTSWLGGGQLLAWDELTNALIVADVGSTELRSWYDDGEEAWYTDIGQPVQDMDALRTVRALALSTSVGSGGRIVLLDAYSGDAITAIDTPAPGLEVAVDTSGSRLALTLEDELHLFRLDLTGGR